MSTPANTDEQPMGSDVKLAGVSFVAVPVSVHTEWVFAEFRDVDGRAGLTEITVHARSAGVATAILEGLERLRGVAVASDADVPRLLGLTVARLREDLTLATAVSSLRSAITLIQSFQYSVSLTEQLGGDPQESVLLYANINRSLIENRSPSAFAAAAERAAREGYAFVKCAPFDDLGPPSTDDGNLQAAGPGIERIAAVATALGDDVGLLVDCHSRFNENSAPLIGEKLAELGVRWFEEPLSPQEYPEALARVASAVPVPIAGGEMGYGAEHFADLVARGAVETVMPDVKHCGGVAEAHAAMRAAIGLGGRASLHSPSGPVSQLAGGHVTAATPGAFALEHAVFETRWRHELLDPPERVEGGRLWLPAGPGLGATLSLAATRRYGREWTP